MLHPTRTLEWTEERNWFFRLSRYQEFLRALIDAHATSCSPRPAQRDAGAARSGAGGHLHHPLAAHLGDPLPARLVDGETQGTWVWFDALPNYLTGTGYPEPVWETRWPAAAHVVGKDINRLHTIVWPAMLQAAGAPAARRVWVHGFVLLGGERFSKSAGVGLELDEAIERFGADAFRYFLLREVPFDADGNFSWRRSRSGTMPISPMRGGISQGRHDCDGREILRRGGAGMVHRQALDASDSTDFEAYRAAMDGPPEGYLRGMGLKAVWR